MSSIFDIQQGLPPITTSAAAFFFQTLLPNIKYNTACNRSAAAAGFSRIVFFYFSIFQCVIVIFLFKA